MLVGVALAASWIPALAAAGVDPVNTLNCEWDVRPDDYREAVYAMVAVVTDAHRDESRVAGHKALVYNTRSL